MAENRRGKDQRFYMSRRQLVLLGAGFTVAASIIFVLGMFVGQAIEARKLMKKEEPLVKIPVNPAAQASGGDPAPAKNEITFNASLPKPGAALASADEKPKAPAVDKPSRVQAKISPSVAKQASPPKPIEKKIEKPADTVKKTEAAAAEVKEQASAWRAQVNAFPDERSAKSVVDRLKDKGYNAYVTEVENRGKTWYRVNVGKFSSRDEADKMAEVLRTKENFPKAFAANR
jgi:cell division protein FtsN